MIRFKIIINCGPCEQFIGKCLESVRTQSFQAWNAFMTVDPCRDNTYAEAVRAAGDDPRTQVRCNKTRRYSMYNFVQAIERSGAESEDVIVGLDGDDWFSDTNAIRM